MDLLESLRQRAATLSEVRLAVLFGSVARGKATRRSDVDLGISVEPDTSAVRRKVQAELERAACRSLDVVFLDGAPPLLRFEISKDGVLLFQKEGHLWTDFKARAMVDWWDWAPLAKRIEDAAIERLREKVKHGQA
jgi:predicted nucleotidyltransferase